VKAAWLPGILLFAVGCGAAGPTAQRDAEDQIPVSTFIDVYVELRQAAARADSAGVESFEAAKREILDRHGITEDALRAFAERRGDDVPTMAKAWETIRDRIAARDSSATGTP
jgi:hypothetical protein